MVGQIRPSSARLKERPPRSIVGFATFLEEAAMKLSILASVVTIAFPLAALAEDNGGVLPKSAEPTASSSRLPPSPGVTDNAPGQQRLTNGSPGDAGNTGSDNGMEASDEKMKSSPLNTGRNAGSTTTGSNVGPREPGDIPPSR